MTAWEIFCQGRYLANRTKKLWFLLWLMNALLAAVAALPVFGVLNAELKNSLMAASLADRFSLDFAGEFAFKYWDSLPSALILIAALGMVYVVLTLLTTGGTLAVFSCTERRFTAPVFFKGCGTYFWRFFRLLIVAAIFYGIFVVALNGVLSSLVNKLTRPWTQQRLVLLVSWTRLLVVAFVFIVVNMVFDYAKVRLVIDEGRSAVMAALRSIKFVFRNFKKTLAVFVFCMLLGLLFIVIYNPLEHVLPQHTRRWIIVVFVLQQLFILARTYVRLTFFSSEVLLYESLRPSHAPAQEAPAAVPTTFEAGSSPSSPSASWTPPPGEAPAIDPTI
ncbi:MAG: hypothetical protein LAO31_12770 [Acidobacteriia bacterium]|nr:hypothetical protein [Terriglobia bacterium]